MMKLNFEKVGVALQDCVFFFKRFCFEFFGKNGCILMSTDID